MILSLSHDMITCYTPLNKLLKDATIISYCDHCDVIISYCEMILSYSDVIISWYCILYYNTYTNYIYIYACFQPNSDMIISLYDWYDCPPSYQKGRTRKKKSKKKVTLRSAWRSAPHVKIQNPIQILGLKSCR